MRWPAAERTGWSARRTVRSMRSSGDAEDAAAGAHEQRRHDRQRQRQADLGRRARAGLGGQQDLAAQLADLGAHGVHPDAAAGDVVGLVAGGEAGGEEQLDGAGHVDRVGLLGGDEPGADGLGGDRVAIDAAAVVGHGDDDVAAGVAGGDPHACRRPACRRPRARRASRGRGRARCARGARAGRRARRRRCGRARCPGRRARARPACRACSRGRGRAAGSAGRRPPRGSSGPA